MQEHILEILRDPDTASELELFVVERRDGAVWQGTLRSVMTRKEYPIHNGIPRFVSDNSYVGSFGLQWNRFSQVQLDSANGARYSHQRFEQETLWSPEQVKGQWMLDAGCGCGRFAEVAAEMGAQVVAMDYSTAVDAAARDLGHLPNIHFIQGDILHPPIKPGSLPYAYSIGVIQHTPDPPATIASLLNLLSPGGRFALTIYARRWYTKLFAKYLLRPVTRRLPARLLLRLIETAMPVLFPLTNVLFSVPVVGKVAQFLIPVANYFDKKEFTLSQRYQEAILDTFDMLSPAYDRPMTAREVRRVFERMGVDHYRFLNTVPINVVGTTPLIHSM